MFAYVFEARSIQSWILSGGRLADMVAASDLVEQLTGGVIGQVLANLNLMEGKKIQIARRAGGAFYAVLDSEAHAHSLRNLMALVVPPFAPGLEFIHTISSGPTSQEALNNAMTALMAIRNQPPPSLPVAGPLVEREPRTGQTAVAFVNTGAERKRGPMSAATLVKRSLSRGQEKLSERFIADSESTDTAWVWPRNMEVGESDATDDDPRTFPFIGKNRQIGVVHADGNGLGQILLKLREAVTQSNQVDYVPLFRDFSNRVEQATRVAAQRATAKVLMPAAQDAGSRAGRACRKLPARPLVLGGDDLSIIVRGELALPFATEFLHQFGLATRDELSAWRQDARWKAVFETPAGVELSAMKYMSACAGVAFFKANQPFELGYHLAETLCQSSKQYSGRFSAASPKPASVTFFRLTTSLADSADELAGSVQIAGKEIPLRVGAYGLEQGTGLVSLETLGNLGKVVEQNSAISAGGLRHLLTVMQEDLAEAKTLYARWRQVLKSRDETAMAAFDEALAKFGRVADETGLPIVQIKIGNNETLVCPLEDLFDWRAVQPDGPAVEAK